MSSGQELLDGAAEYRYRRAARDYLVVEHDDEVIVENGDDEPHGAAAPKSRACGFGIRRAQDSMAVVEILSFVVACEPVVSGGRALPPMGSNPYFALVTADVDFPACSVFDVVETAKDGHPICHNR